MTWVCAYCQYWNRQKNCNKLRGFSRSIFYPWCCFGDFNTVVSQVEEKGGEFREDKSIRSFQELISDLVLIDASFKGCPFTWCNHSED